MTTAIDRIRDLPHGSHVEWQGYTIKLGERGMIWVSKGGCNPMPGACCFETEADAKKGIAALVVAKTITKNWNFGEPTLGDVFWSLLELSR